jgi:hypothetical protein
MLSLQRKLFLQIDYAEADIQQLEKMPMHLYHASVWARASAAQFLSFMALPAAPCWSFEQLRKSFR